MDVDDKTIMDYYQIFRDLTQNYFEREVIGKNQLLGGPGKYVEIDEKLMFKAKYHRGLNRDQIWVFGLIERGTNKVAMFPVQKRDRSTLLPIIEANVALGTIVVSWRAYLGISSFKRAMSIAL
uniref:DDE_Tnp_IS1595 domain-containing protein n=1 Tax=Caenorhabditis tropicalis TaxID=1561998 RepID=A0A1I7UX16_9PELO